MHWVLGLLGAFLGSLFGDADEALLGLAAGAFIGWQAARISELRRRISALEAAQMAASRPASPAPTLPPRSTSVATPPPRPLDAAAETPAVATVPPPVRAPEAVAADAEYARATLAAEQAAAARASAEAETRRRAAEVAAAVTAAARQDATAARPRVRAEPDLADRAVATVKSWLFEGNVPVKLGMLVLFFGVAAALKYAVDQGYVALPIEVRLMLIAAGALAGLVWGWRNRELRPAFGLSLQGGAIGVLLLTTFAAFRLYSLLPAGIAFGLVLVLVAGAALLALLQNAVWLAVLGFVGGYLAPVLISTGSGNHVALFTYYALLNAAVFGIAWRRPWRALNLIGFAFTFAVGTLWGAKYYRPEHFATVEPFLVLFFLFYVAIAVLYTLRSTERQPLIDGTLLFGTPLLAFPLQAALLDDDRMGLAFSALAVGALYGGLGVWLHRRRQLGLMAQAFGALAIGFATLAVPLALSARWTSASWAVEGAALIWLGLRQQRRLPQGAGWALQLLAAAAYAVSLLDQGWSREAGEWVLLNGHTLGVLLMALAAYFISWMYEREQAHRLLIWLGFVLGTGWWVVAGLREAVEHFSHFDGPHVLLAFGAISATLAALLRGAIPWPRLGWLVLAVALLGLPLVLYTEIDLDGAITLRTNLYWLGWFAALFYGLASAREPHQRGLSIAHVAVLVTAAWLYGAALHEAAARAALDDGWRYVAALLPLTALLLATWRAPPLGAWPLAAEFPRYRARWFAPALAALGIAWLAALAEPGNSAPLPWLPLLNPIELLQLGVLLVAIGLVRRDGASTEIYRPALAAAAFLFVTFAGLRAVHQLQGAPWSPQILDDRIAQATLTVLWSVLGVTAWIYGSRRRLWSVWLAGAILMGVVLAKLVLVDRQYVGNLAGIVSFMAVGALLVLVGRIAPTPPRHRQVELEVDGVEESR